MSYILKDKHNTLFFLNINNIEGNCLITFFKFFQSSFFRWKIYSFPFIFIYKRFNLCYSFRVFLLFLCNLMQILQHIESICCLFYWWDLLLLFCFYSNQHNRYMVLLDLDLFYEICNTITEHNRRLPFIDSNLFWYLFSNFMCFIINHDFYIVVFWMYCVLFIIIYGKNKVIC